MSTKAILRRAFKDASNAKRKYYDKYGAGNIDLNNRKVVHNKDGSFSTEESFSTNIDGKEVLLPTIIDGKRVSQRQAINHYYKTGKHLGKFDSVEEADDYAVRLHERQGRKYKGK